MLVETFIFMSTVVGDNLQPKCKDALLIRKLKYALMMDMLLFHFPFALCKED